MSVSLVDSDITAAYVYGGLPGCWCSARADAVEELLHDGRSPPLFAILLTPLARSGMAATS